MNMTYIHVHIDNFFSLINSLVPGDANKEDNGPIPVMEGDGCITCYVIPLFAVAVQRLL